MIRCTGDIWEAWDSADLFLCTTNGSITTDGRLVMGAGIARQVKERFPGIDLKLGKAVKTHGTGISKRCYHYGLLISPDYPQKKLGLFQTKYGWQEDSTIKLIEYSLSKLSIFIDNHPNDIIHMPMPGIGHGKLPIDEVEPLLMQLPDTVHVWTYK